MKEKLYYIFVALGWFAAFLIAAHFDYLVFVAK